MLTPTGRNPFAQVSGIHTRREVLQSAAGLLPTLLPMKGDTMEEWMSPIDAMVEKHRWNGSYYCGCGAEMNSPQTWSRHVLEDAWTTFTRVGVEATGVTVVSRVQFDRLVTDDEEAS